MTQSALFEQNFRFVLPGGNSGVEPPDPLPNSEVKRASADGSAALAV
jgi:hypothetical protein